MPRCIECYASVGQVIHPDTQTVERCPQCGNPCDTYYEFGKVQKWIDVALLQRRAWVHLLFNESGDLFTYFLVGLLCCVLEAFVVRTRTVWAEVLVDEDAMASKGIFLNDNATTLQIVKIIQSPVLPLMDYSSTLPRLAFYALVEYFILTVVAVWAGHQLCAPDAKYEEELVRWVRAVMLATATKLVYGLFLIWKGPPLVLPVVDTLFVVWMICGFSTLLLDRWWLYSAPAVLLCVGARLFFRYLTGWSAQTMW